MISCELYSSIVETLNSTSSLQEWQETVETKYPNVSPLTLGSIVRNLVQRRMKKAHHSYNTSEHITNFYQRFLAAVSTGEQSGIILRMSDEAGLCPVLMARFVLEGHLREEQQQASAAQTTKQVAKDGTTVTRVPPINLMAIKADVSRLLKDVSEIRHPQLAYEVHLTTVYDQFYGPIPDAVKQSVGKEYENVLETQLTELGITFIDEAELRKRGYDKTPDFKLELPIAIGNDVVNWVESKATFGDEETHKTYVEEQLSSYKNRFGPGLVIYWLGYVESLHQESITPDGILVRESMPKSVTHMKVL